MSGLEQARSLDAADPLRELRSKFHLPVGVDGQAQVYLCGNSLGLQPKATSQWLTEELEDWAQLGVEGHFKGRRPWYDYHEFLQEPLTAVVGARPDEVVAMNGLTTNLHLLMVSFYRPTPQRYRILTAAGAFPSDRYAVASQARFHGHDPADAIVEWAPRPGEWLLRTEDLEALLADQGEQIALVLLSGVHFYTGQAIDMARITQAGHAAGCAVGFDLAHAAGNLHLKLHDWNVDFAAWCSYKYLNAGPGSVGCAFVHQRHADRPELPRFAGWWGNDPGARFEMAGTFTPQAGAAGWQLSNAPVFAMAPLLASLRLFEQAGVWALRRKSEQLTAFVLELLDELPAGGFEVITPREADARGCQLSLLVAGQARRLNEALLAENVVCDHREPDVIRLAPVPMYNTFEDVWHFVDTLRRLL